MSSLRSGWAFICLFLGGVLAFGMFLAHGTDWRLAAVLSLFVMIAVSFIMDVLSTLGGDHRESSVEDRLRDD